MFKHDDGGRGEAGYAGKTGDCVTRAIAIAAQLPYQTVYDELNKRALKERPRKGRKRSNARTGVGRRTYEPYLLELGFKWVPTMHVGKGCKVHLSADELPKGRLVVRVSRHLCAMVDGVVHDNHDPRRDGTRCVYGYFIKEEPKLEPEVESTSTPMKSPSGKYTYAYVDGPDDEWLWAIVTDYQGAQAYDHVVMGFARDNEPNVDVVRKILWALDAP